MADSTPITNAQQVLVHIKNNPGCSKNSIARYVTGGNSMMERQLGRLLRQGLVRIETDERGYHSVYPVETA